MSAPDKIFAYCERGLDAGLWAEPLNALSNFASLAVALWALSAWRRAAPADRDWTGLALITLVALIGVGSALFHTFATPMTRLADTLPIGAFMLAYLAFALRRFVGAGRTAVTVAVAALAGSIAVAGSLRCGGATCLNGSLGYIPALAALGLVGGVLLRRRQPAAPHLVAAAAVFAVALTLRTIDQSICPLTVIGGRAFGTHFLWHVLNALVLALLLGAASRSRARRQGRS